MVSGRGKGMLTRLDNTSGLSGLAQEGCGRQLNSAAQRRYHSLKSQVLDRFLAFELCEEEQRGGVIVQRRRDTSPPGMRILMAS